MDKDDILGENACNAKDVILIKAMREACYYQMSSYVNPSPQ